MAFFSGTDLNTLKEEGADYNHFLSLIVNNEGKYAAAITRKIITTSKGNQNLSYKTFNDKIVDLGASNFEKENISVEYYPLEITVEKFEEPKSELELRLEEVRSNANSYINSKSNYVPYVVSTNAAKEESKIIQPTLFTPEEMGEKKGSIKWEDDAYNIDYARHHINPTILSNTITQIITGDILSIYKSNIDLNKWVINMEAIYNKRFEDTAKGESFRYWVDTFVEFLENELCDENLIDKGPDYMTAIWANDVVTKLEEFPKNPYLDVFITAFKRWLI